MRAAFLSVLALFAFCASAQEGPGVSLERMTWVELRDAIRAGSTTLLLPIGGTEQNGPHIVLGKHDVRARVLAERIAARLGNAIVAPVIAYVPEGAISPPAAHMRFPGTITIPEDAFEKTLESAARSFHLHGFRLVVFLGDHGGYHASLRRVAARLNREAKRDWVIVPAQYYRELPHAGREDTSLSLAIDPKLVRSDRIGGLARDQGVLGDARGASAEQGRALADAIVSETAEAIRRAATR